MASTDTLRYVPEPIAREVVDSTGMLDWPEWRSFQKKVPTKALRMSGPFTVATSEGELKCEDGWLCLDARGYPYPVAADEFELIYAPLAPLVGGLVEFIRANIGDADGGKTLEEATVAELLEAAWWKISAAAPSPAPAPREFALAKTAIEDARMRYTRGRAMQLGVFKPVDLDSEDSIEERYDWTRRVRAEREAEL